MFIKCRRLGKAAAIAAALVFVFRGGLHAQEGDRDIRHVLLISVDGLHALDVANYVAAHPDSALAELSGHAVTYSNARTPANSDSFPGLLALVTGSPDLPLQAMKNALPRAHASALSSVVVITRSST